MMEVTRVRDGEVFEAMDVIRQYCEEHRECEECIIDCSVLKRGIAPCFWVSAVHLQNRREG